MQTITITTCKTGTSALQPYDSGQQKIVELLAENGMFDQGREDILITAAKVFHTEKNSNQTKYFAILYNTGYKILENSFVEEVSVFVLPVVMTVGEKYGSPTLEVLQVAGDGSGFKPSIEAFCTDFSGKQISGLSEKMVDYYRDYDALQQRHSQKVKSYFSQILGAYTVFSDQDVSVPLEVEETLVLTTGFAVEHKGIDIFASKGQDILSIRDGVVADVVEDRQGEKGLHVIINHGGTLQSVYANCSKILVSKGDKIEKGQKMAEAGKTGKATGVHLHFEMLVDGQPINPTEFFFIRSKIKDPERMVK